MAENPVIRRFDAATRANNVATPSAVDLQKQFDQPPYTGPRPGQRFMTLDDVVQRTGAMLLVILAAGAVTWSLTSGTAQGIGPVFLVALMGGLGLGLFMAFTGRANATLCLLYSAFEGVLLGTISKLFETRWPGIVIQALTGTVMVAVGMLFVYKIGAIRVTPRFTRMLFAGMIGVVALMLGNLVVGFFNGGSGFGLRDGGPLAIIFSLVCIALAAFSFLLDFDAADRLIRAGAPERAAWGVALGLTVTLVWLYIEILRLLSYFNSD